MKSMIMLAAVILLIPVTVSAGEDGFIELLNGKNLDGWKVRGGTAEYKFEDGEVVGTTVEGSKNTFLCTEKEYGDFDLRLEVKCDPELNSGVQIRSHVYKEDTPQMSNENRIREAGEVYGYQCEIDDQGSSSSGWFWDEARRTKWLNEESTDPKAKEAFKQGEWNHYRIVAVGNRVQSWVNGVKTAEFTDDLDKKGFIGLQVHSIKKGTGPFSVRWKNVMIKELTEEKK